MAENTTIAIPIKKPRTFLPEAFAINNWAEIAPFFKNLQERPINSVADLNKWLADRSELEAVLQEDMGWRYIRMTVDTTDEAAAGAFNFFITEIEPQIAPIENELNQKLLASSFVNQLTDEGYKIMLRSIRKSVEIFREDNVQLNSELQAEAQQYAVIAGAMTINHNGKELTLQQAANLLKEQDRDLRQTAYDKISSRRLADKAALDQLFSNLIAKRHQVGINAGFANYRDYMFAAMARFDYTADDCFNFHSAIHELIVPICEDFDEERRVALHLDALKPWDRDVDVSGKEAPKPFDKVDELVDKTITCFQQIHPFLGQCMQVLKAMKHVDLDSRIGKAPGGYNYPLYETNVPFIFMNATHSLHDMVTMVHEGGHAVHSLLVKDLINVGFKSTPSEVAELASMSMELISMEHWDVYFPDADELKRAKKDHLEDILRVLPWVAAIDKFQHWLYENPAHSLEERSRTWTAINYEFTGNVLNWDGQEQAFANSWQKQLHLFEVPFYYIEYGMAQLGAIAMWKNYKENPAKTIEQYMDALRLGYTKSISDIYKTAGIKFDFAPAYVQSLTDFVKAELAKLN